MAEPAPCFVNQVLAGGNSIDPKPNHNRHLRAAQAMFGVSAPGTGILTRFMCGSWDGKGSETLDLTVGRSQIGQGTAKQC